MPYQIFVELSRKHQRAKSLLNTPVTKKKKIQPYKSKRNREERSYSKCSGVEMEWIYTISFDGGQQRERARGREVVSRPCQTLRLPTPLCGNKTLCKQPRGLH